MQQELMPGRHGVCGYAASKGGTVFLSLLQSAAFILAILVEEAETQTVGPEAEPGG